jgi:Domain of Unknown Function (DUF1206)
VSTVERAARTEPVGWLGRVGLATQGLPYLLVGALAVLVAVPGHQARESNEGALRALARNDLGRVVLIAAAAGFAADALWRLASAIGDRQAERSGTLGWGRRVGQGVLGLVYLAIALGTIRLLSGGSAGGNAPQHTRTAFDHPLGRELVFAAGLGFAVAAAWALWETWSRRFMERLDCPREARRVCAVSGVLGHAGRGVVWAFVAWFLLKAAWQYDPNEAVGLDGALRKLQDEPYGASLLAAVGLGLLGYAFFCFVQARYRRV